MKKIFKRYKKILRISRIRNLRWIDVLGIFIFFLILASSAFFFLRSPGDVIVTVRLSERDAPDFFFNRPRNIIVDKLKPGLKETDELGRNAIEVIDVYRYLSNNVYFDVFVTLKMKTTHNKRTGQHSFNGKPILVGSFHTFRLKDFVLKGIIVDISDEVSVRERKTFLIEGYLDQADHEAGVGNIDYIVEVDGVRNYLAKMVVPGLKMLDSNSEVIAEILSVDKFPGEIGFIQNSRYMKIRDPERTRVELTMKLVTERINDQYYYQKDAPLNIGGKVEFVSSSLRIFPTITSIQELE